MLLFVKDGRMVKAKATIQSEYKRSWIKTRYKNFTEFVPGVNLYVYGLMKNILFN